MKILDAESFKIDNWKKASVNWHISHFFFFFAFQSFLFFYPACIYFRHILVTPEQFKYSFSFSFSLWFPVIINLSIWKFPLIGGN